MVYLSIYKYIYYINKFFLYLLLLFSFSLSTKHTRYNIYNNNIIIHNNNNDKNKNNNNRLIQNESSLNDTVGGRGYIYIK